MKLIIAGSRSLNIDKGFLDQIITFHVDGTNDLKLELVCGEAIGIDSSGRVWAENLGIKIHSFPVTAKDWKKIGKSAGYKRNVKMGEFADALLVIWDGESKGSGHMKNIMVKMKKPVYNAIVTKTSIDEDMLVWVEKVSMEKIK